nr:hypothetical protein [Arthrobacter sp. H-02-3]
MTALLIIVLLLALRLAFPSPRVAGRRTRNALHGAGPRSFLPREQPSSTRSPGRSTGLRSRGRRAVPGLRRVLAGGSAGVGAVPMTVVVQQLAALLKGGRTPARLWDELWVLYGAEAAEQGAAVNRTVDASVRASVRGAGRDGAQVTSGPVLDPESLRVLAAARAAALGGSSVARAIRRRVSGGPAGGVSGAGAAFGGAVSVRAGRDARVWGELAACFDTAEASGCPLADVLARFAAHLEAEDDAEGARQTALAGPRATIRLLTWLPVSGLGLGLLLGVDPMATLLGNPWGLLALAAGVVLTAAGRVWSSKLVRAAAGAHS